MTTIDNIMALHDEAAKWKAEHYWQEDRGTSDEVFNEVEKRMEQSREALRTALTDSHQEAFARGMAVRPASAAQPAREPANWYCIDKSGMATLCADEDDALQNAKLAALDWPNNAPYRAMQLVEAQPVREPLTDERIAEIVEYLPENSDEQIQDDPAKFIRDFIRTVEREHGIGGDK